MAAGCILRLNNFCYRKITNKLQKYKNVEEGVLPFGHHKNRVLLEHTLNKLNRIVVITGHIIATQGLTNEASFETKPT